MFIQHDAGVYTSDLSNSPDVAVYTILRGVYTSLLGVYISLLGVYTILRNTLCVRYCV